MYTTRSSRQAVTIELDDLRRKFRIFIRENLISYGVLVGVGVGTEPEMVLQCKGVTASVPGAADLIF